MTGTIEAVLARVAATVAGSAAKAVLRPKRPGAGLVTAPGRAALPGRQAARLGEKELGRLVDDLAGRLRRACAAGPYAELPEAERLAAVEAVRDAFQGLAGLDELMALDLDAEALASRVGRPVAGLSPAAESLRGELLALCCRHAVEIATALPSFGPRADVELIRRSGEAQRALEEIRERLPGDGAGAGLAFEQRYAEYVAETYARVELFGLTLGRTSTDLALDTAYISLAVSGAEAELGHREGPHGFGRPAIRVEEALADGQRLLLRGPAGSGKSTLMQWLAVNTARRRFAGRLAEWNRCVPFVLRLREINARGGELPMPEDFMTAARVPMGGAAPDGWAQDLLEAGRALVLIDGVDEIPERMRKQTRDWLKGLVTAFPGARYVVTTRPSAVPEDWLATLGFEAHSLLPMEREGVAEFIAHWHAAAQLECEDEALAQYEQSLKEAVTTRRDLGRLATNPLMCALLCALNRDRRMYLPRARMELYDAALDMLLIRRDTERQVSGTEGVELGRSEQLLLLRRLAYWLIRNDQDEAEQSEAVEMVAEWLTAMPQLAGSAEPEKVFRHLLIRSGLLREPSPGVVDFVHRTFKDYLGAAAAVEARDFGVLVRHAHDDKWDDVVRMAVGHARPDERVRVLRGLLRRADKVKRHRQRLVLLAAACLEYALEVDPAVRDEVERRTRELLPPYNPEEAEELAKIGPLVLELLPDPAQLDEWAASACVRCAASIGGDAALAWIRRVPLGPRGVVEGTIGEAWRSFPAAEYADVVLLNTSQEESWVAVHTREQLEQLPRLPHHTRPTIYGCPLDLPDDLHLLRHVRTLGLFGTPGVSDLQAFRPLPELRELALQNLEEIESLEPLRGSSLEALYLYGLRRDLDLSPLADLPELTSFCIDTPVPGDSLDGLPLNPGLTQLGLYEQAGNADLSGVDRWPGLTTMTLSGPHQYDQIRLLSRLPELKWLNLREQETPDLRALTPCQHLETLIAIDVQEVLYLEALRDMPNLTFVSLGGPTPLDLSPLADLDHLTISVGRKTPFTGADRIPRERFTLPARRPAG
ncbi:NACHT domain-containing protein [Streptomyces sp. A7024]|uniref:NACHT domain-containing protein n=1 Tax=Streptomyces coryli TaxID=1128680 RepID=A0A6G4TYK9_9ACTN|nr:NACHT domain-containing protein [Streptomyces coryli]NGN64208.1 NACHT domain-containing protein [Streptomyces coryli]